VPHIGRASVQRSPCEDASSLNGERSDQLQYTASSHDPVEKSEMR
jgi:hypothetical protein